jgi:membrane protein YdbS with pleckstrin-like domain
MEILIAIAVSVVVSGVKLLSTKLGMEQSKNVVLGFVFVLCLVSAILYTKEIITLELVQSWLSMVLMAVGWYQTIVKLVISPAIDRFLK